MLINNAGVLRIKSARDFDPDTYDMLMNINVMSPMMLTKCV